MNAESIRKLFDQVRRGALTPDDAVGYDTLARNIMNGQGFSLQAGPPFEPTLYRTPVYPYFLVGLYSVFGFQAMGDWLGDNLVGMIFATALSRGSQRSWQMII